MAKNGETEMTTEGMSVADKLDFILEAIEDLQEQVTELAAQQVEILDKICNLDVGGDGFSTIDLDN